MHTVPVVGERQKVQLMGAWEIRQRLGYSEAWTQRLITRRDFPAPYAVLRGCTVWAADDVEAWIKTNRPHLDDNDGA